MTDKFLTPGDVRRDAPAVEWVVRPLIARGAITEIVGAPKKAGKSTFLYACCKAVADGGPGIFGQKHPPGPVVYLTEQPLTSLREELDTAGISDEAPLYLLPYTAVFSEGWAETVQMACQKAEEVGAIMLVIDTLPQFLLNGGASENDAEDIIPRLQPLFDAASRGLAVVVVRHERKQGGSVGSSGRGSSAITGAMDIIVQIRPKGRGSTLRRLNCLSRFHETPSEIEMDWNPQTGEYKLESMKGESVIRRPDEHLKETLAALPGTVAQLVEATDQSRSTVLRHIQFLEADDRLDFDFADDNRTKIWRLK